MKRIGLLCCVLLVSCTGSFAQNPVPISIYAGGGISFPLEPDANFASESNSGYNVSVTLGYKVLPMLEFQARVEHTRFGNDVPGEIEDYDWRMTLIGGAVKAGLAAPRMKYRPYVLAGFGAGISKRNEGLVGTIITYPGVAERTDTYYDVGGGIEVPLTSMVTLFAQGRYVYINAQPEAISYLPLTVGIKLF
jgi:opacity protein-like surface antigen